MAYTPSWASPNASHRPTSLLGSRGKAVEEDPMPCLYATTPKKGQFGQRTEQLPQGELMNRSLDGHPLKPREKVPASNQAMNLDEIFQTEAAAAAATKPKQRQRGEASLTFRSALNVPNAKSHLHLIAGGRPATPPKIRPGFATYRDMGSFTGSFGASG
eukprot:CAMPEP_0174308402 /NCGR_PEP_ID=MMETSP0810-20121108/1740_1 /TAXON_ID=73025 ORGANISM="Eutreptiella gymnastica-like, Strain CCMP1594" /NCGR_SAMPLE_ID=MMETSP0810 /ASSEMBLY_ACC=CAM_ASM_000659 /LENGTH=158 /DNA_ID=CAMNT_0015415731 /DNA_START=18 /DNA_END=494 /DNA_ORIENTATION=+